MTQFCDSSGLIEVKYYAISTEYLGCCHLLSLYGTRGIFAWIFFLLGGRSPKHKLRSVSFGMAETSTEVAPQFLRGVTGA